MPPQRADHRRGATPASSRHLSFQLLTQDVPAALASLLLFLEWVELVPVSEALLLVSAGNALPSVLGQAGPARYLVPAERCSLIPLIHSHPK